MHKKKIVQIRFQVIMRMVVSHPTTEVISVCISACNYAKTGKMCYDYNVNSVFTSHNNNITTDYVFNSSLLVFPQHSPV